MANTRRINLELINNDIIRDYFNNTKLPQSTLSTIHDTLDELSHNDLKFYFFTQYHDVPFNNTLPDNINHIKYGIYIKHDKDPDELCYFELSGIRSISNPKNIFGSGGPIFMWISTDPLESRLTNVGLAPNFFSKKQIARIMIGIMLKVCKDKFNVDLNQKFGIDDDASGGFWNCIGMKDISVKSKKNTNEKGQSKIITFDEVYRWAFGTNCNKEVCKTCNRPVTSVKRKLNESNVSSKKTRSTKSKNRKNRKKKVTNDKK